jgi:hypothetical protein
MAAYLPGESKDGFVQQLTYKATDATEAKITIFLVANRDSKSNAAVHLNVTAIDTDITKH